MACSATSPNFHLPPRHETSNLDVNVSLKMANLHMVNILALDFHVLQHLGDNRSETQLHRLTTIPLILVHKIYQHIINGTQHIMPLIQMMSQQNIQIQSGLCLCIWECTLWL